MKLKEVVEAIKQKTGLQEKEIFKLIDQKQKELDNLITKEGAAMLVAKQLGITIELEKEKRLQIKNLVPGLKNINIAGRIFKIGKVVEFEKNGNKGRFVKIYVGDETGYFVLTLWNDQVSYVEDEMLKPGDTIEIARGIVKENIFGQIEVSLGRFGIIRKVSLPLPSEEELAKLHFETYTKTTIDKIGIGNYQISGMIVHIFKSNFVFEFCPFCKSRIESSYCPDHGQVESDYSAIINAILDDETSTLRVVFFKNTSEALLGMDSKKIASIDNKYDFICKKLLGKEVIVKGKVRKNPLFNRLELIADSAEFLNISELTNELAQVV